MKFRRVRQNLISAPLLNVAAEVHRQLDALDLRVPQGEVALTAGSRGISNIPAIIRAAGDWLKAQGAKPFIAPCMGSHNGATAEGQRAMIESLGITEESMAMPIRSSMDVVKVGEVATGAVWMDRHCFESAGVLVVNRVKLHTCFSGPIQSGLVKMMVIGMGKIKSAQTFHRASAQTRKDMLIEMGKCLVDSGKILAGLAILEDGFDETAELHGVPPRAVLDREPALLERHRHYFPALPVDDINVLVVDEIGKVFSGTGMDTNVIGYRGIRHYEDLERPRIGTIAALGLSPRSQGNAFGVGLADFITRRLRDAIDEERTFINVYTTGDMRRMAIPCTLRDDQEVFDRMLERYGQERWLIIPNTLHLGVLHASEDLADELASNPRCVVDEEGGEARFVNGRHQFKWG